MASKLLYITANSKPEEFSTSKTIARDFINKYLKFHPEDTVEEIDLYKSSVPMLNYKLFSGRATLASGAEYEHLSEEEKKDVDRINELCDQFLSADKYIISAPMWSLFFPAILKQYLDCIFINGKTIQIADDKVKGLLGDKERKMVYIQSSGGAFPVVLGGKINKGLHYLKDVFHFLGIHNFRNILIEGVDESSIGKTEAIKEAKIDVDLMVKKF
jgi:FMN-dependent NADH-azoreductase